MGPDAIVGASILSQEARQVGLVHDHNVIEAFAAYRTDQPLAAAILPGRSWCRGSIQDAHGSKPALEGGAVSQGKASVI